MKLLRRAVADLMRGSVRCMFPIVALLAWAALLFVPQGSDVLWTALDRVCPKGATVDCNVFADGSFSDLAFLWLATLALGLSVWYSMRWLLGADMVSLPMAGPPTSLPRTWLPRLAGAVVPGLVAVIVPMTSRFPDIHPLVQTTVSAAFAIQSLAMLLFLWVRARLIRRWGVMAYRAPGRAADGGPGMLAMNQALPSGTVVLLVWAMLLTLLLGVVFTVFPLTMPRVAGAMAVGAIALASMNLFGSFVLTYLPMRRGLPPLAPWVLLYAMAIGAFNDNHGVHPATVQDAPGRSAIAPEQAFTDWSADLPDGATVYIVATEGGGARAAYFTAAVLGALQDQVSGFTDHLFALSAVSGGSVGAGVWAASIHPERCRLAAGPSSAAAPANSPSPTRMLSADFLSPVLAGFLYYDMAQRFIPFPFETLDRSRGLEEGWQRVAYRIPDRPLEKTIAAFYDGCQRMPELLLNATVAETGHRAVLTRMATGGFIDTNPLTDASGRALTTSTQSVAGLMHQGARFPFISPAGSIRSLPDPGAGFWRRAGSSWWPDTRLRLVDGGYFDNSGVQTAMELLQQLRPDAPFAPAAPVPAMIRKHLRPVLIVISSDVGEPPLCAPPSDTQFCPDVLTAPRPTEPAVWRWFHELTPPLRGLYDVRDSHIHVELRAAIRSLDHQVITLHPPDLKPGQVEPPLGWVLSAGAQKNLKDGAASAVGSYVAHMTRQP